MADSNQVIDASGVKIPASTRYYRLHREERIAKYHSRPDVIAKKEEREKKKAEKEAEIERKREERKRIREQNRLVAIATSKLKPKIEENLDAFLDGSFPVCENS